MTRVIAFLALVAMLTAGCTSTSDDGDGPGADPDPTAPPDQAAGGPAEIEVTLTDCTIPEAFARVAADQVRPHVPEDFDLALNEAGQAVVVLGGLVCGTDGNLSKRGLVAILVTPTDDALTDPEVGNYFWEPEHYLVPGTLIADAFVELGANATYADDVRASVTSTAAQLVIDAGDVRHSITGLLGAGPAGETAFAFGHFREYSAADGGYVYLDASFDGPEGSTAGTTLATVETGAGTVARQLLGESSVLPILDGAGLTYADARVGFVAR